MIDESCVCEDASGCRDGEVICESVMVRFIAGCVCDQHICASENQWAIRQERLERMSINTDASLY